MKKCKHGHLRNAENTYLNNRGHVVCRPCRLLSTKKYSQKNYKSLGLTPRANAKGKKKSIYDDKSAVITVGK